MKPRKLKGTHFYTEAGKEIFPGKVTGIMRSNEHDPTTTNIILSTTNDGDITLASNNNYDYIGKWKNKPYEGDIKVKHLTNGKNHALIGEWTDKDGDRGYWIFQLEEE